VDGLPNTVMEIMASATPLVATAAGGIGAVAIDDVTARIVAERDAEGLAAAIGGLLRQPELSKAIGHRARETVCRDHSWERVAQAFDEIYRTVDARAQRSPRPGGTH
jgi:glycosyltransferase involved in cell wall biosynthesis